MVYPTEDVGACWNCNKTPEVPKHLCFACQELYTDQTSNAVRKTYWKSIKKKYKQAAYNIYTGGLYNDQWWVDSLKQKAASVTPREISVYTYNFVMAWRQSPAMVYMIVTTIAQPKKMWIWGHGYDLYGNKLDPEHNLYSLVLQREQEFTENLELV